MHGNRAATCSLDHPGHDLHGHVGVRALEPCPAVGPEVVLDPAVLLLDRSHQFRSHGSALWPAGIMDVVLGHEERVLAQFLGDPEYAFVTGGGVQESVRSFLDQFPTEAVEVMEVAFGDRLPGFGIGHRDLDRGVVDFDHGVVATVDKQLQL